MTIKVKTTAGEWTDVWFSSQGDEVCDWLAVEQLNREAVAYVLLNEVDVLYRNRRIAKARCLPAAVHAIEVQIEAFKAALGVLGWVTGERVEVPE